MEFKKTKKPTGTGGLPYIPKWDLFESMLFLRDVVLYNISSQYNIFCMYVASVSLIFRTISNMFEGKTQSDPEIADNEITGDGVQTQTI